MKIKIFSNKCPICGSKIKLSWKYRCNYRGLHVNCSVCGTELANSPIMVPIVILEIIIIGMCINLTEWQIFNFIIACPLGYLTVYTLPLLSPIAWIEDMDISEEELRELWKKEQREQNKKD